MGIRQGVWRPVLFPRRFLELASSSEEKFVRLEAGGCQLDGARIAPYGASKICVAVTQFQKQNLGDRNGDAGTDVPRKFRISCLERIEYRRADSIQSRR